LIVRSEGLVLRLQDIMKRLWERILEITRDYWILLQRLLETT